MKKKYRLIRLLVAGFVLINLLIVGSSIASRAAVLSPGDIAFVEMNVDNPDSMKFLVLADISEGTTINFTDNGWYASDTWRANEGVLTWTAPTGGVSCGTVVGIDGTSSTTHGTVSQTSGSYALSTSGDQIVAYEDADWMITAINNEGSATWQSDATSSNTSTLPQGLTNGTNAVAIQEIDNAMYDGSLLSGTKAQLLAAINNSSNWIGDNSNQQTFSLSFTVTDCSGSESAPAVSSTSPTASASDIAIDTDITINFSENVVVTGTWYNISCTGSGTHTAVVTGGPQSFTLNPGTNFNNSETCTVTVYAAQVTDQDTDDPPDNMNSDYVFNFDTSSGSSITYIHTIQGSTDTSPLDGSIVTIEGIVVGDFQDTVGGFYVQEEDADADADPATSEGIYIYSTTAVDVGDQVRVTGTVDEYFGETQLGSSPSISINSSGNTLPSAASPTIPVTAVSDWERYEGMRVNFSQTLFVTEIYQLGRYGQLTLADQRLYQPTHQATPGAPAIAVAADNLLHTIILDDGSSVSNPDPIRWPSPTGLSAANTVRGGDSVSSVEGVITYRYDFYRVFPTADPTFRATATNPRMTAPVSEGTLRVSSFNVLNYFNGPSFPTARGAETVEEFTRQRDKIIAAILGLNADIIGLMEIENDGYGSDSAIQDLVNGLNAAAGAGTYAFINPGTADFGGDEIAVGIIYRPASVSPVGVTAYTDTNAFFQTGGRNRQPMAQTFQEISSGETFTVVVNHFKSKGSACDAPLPPFPADPDTGDGQGNCNITRTMAAQDLLTWLASDPTGSGDTDFLIMGDLNSYALEDPITTIKNASYIDLINTYQGLTGYSYVYDGQLGYLDYALASPTIAGQVTSATHWHINADEPLALDYNTNYKTDSQITDLYAADAYRASDHDPVVIDLFMPYGLADMSDLDSGYEVAAHKAPHNIWLGASVDDDTTFAANSDNASDDGVEIISGTWAPGQTVTLQAQVSGGNGWLSGWFDWNLDGVFTDPGEKSVNQAVVSGNNNISIAVPADAQIGRGGTENDEMPVRFRLYESATEPATIVMAPMAAELSGSIVGGEVEDYIWGFTPNAISLQNFGIQNTPVNWGFVLSVVAGFIVLTIWGWRRYRKGKQAV